MSRHRRCTVHIILIGLLWLGGSVTSAQTMAPAGQTPTGQGAAPRAQSVEGLVRPETVGMHKTATQTRLEALEQLLLSPEEAEALTVKSGSPNVLPARAPKVIVWSVFDTVRLALAVLPVPPLVEVTLPVVLM